MKILEKLWLIKQLNWAEKFNSKVWMLQIAAPDPDFVGNKVGPQYIRDFLANEIRNEHRQLSKYADDLKAKGIEADGLVIQGPTVEMVLLEIEKLSIALLVIGHRPHSFCTGCSRKIHMRF